MSDTDHPYQNLNCKKINSTQYNLDLKPGNWKKSKSFLPSPWSMNENYFSIVFQQHYKIWQPERQDTFVKNSQKLSYQFVSYTIKIWKNIRICFAIIQMTEKELFFHSLLQTIPKYNNCEDITPFAKFPNSTTMKTGHLCQKKLLFTNHAFENLKSGDFKHEFFEKTRYQILLSLRTITLFPQKKHEEFLSMKIRKNLFFTNHSLGDFKSTDLKDFFDKKSNYKLLYRFI